MGITAKTFLQSKTLAALQAEIATAIAAGKQPSGDVFIDPESGLMTQAMVAGDDNSGIAAYAANGALANTGGLLMLTKAGVGAYTLAAPSADGVEAEIVNTTANAHVVTATDLIEDGATGGAKDTMTFAAFAGAAIRLRGYGGKWHVIAKNLVTVAAV